MRSYGDYHFFSLPARGDTIIVYGTPAAEVVRVKHIEHRPPRADAKPELGDATEHRVQIFVDFVEDID